MALDRGIPSAAPPKSSIEGGWEREELDLANDLGLHGLTIAQSRGVFSERLRLPKALASLQEYR